MSTDEITVPTSETMSDVAVASATDRDTDETRLYELGFHIVPLVGEDGLTEEVGKIRSAIESNGGSVFAEEWPVLLDLAYPMRCTIARTRHTFDAAFFGWMKFESLPETTLALKKALNGEEHILRYLLTTTTREVVPLRVEATRENMNDDADTNSNDTSNEADDSSDSDENNSDDVPEEKAPRKEKMDKDAVDAEIDKLVAE